VLVAETRSVHSDQQRSLTCIQELLVQIKFILLDKTRHTRSSVVCSPTAIRATPYGKLVPVIKILKNAVYAYSVLTLCGKGKNQ